MSLKKNLKSKRPTFPISLETVSRTSWKQFLKGQAVVEYIVTFMVLAAGILVVFSAFNPDNLGIKSVFERAINNAISEINRP